MLYEETSKVRWQELCHLCWRHCYWYIDSIPRGWSARRLRDSRVIYFSPIQCRQDEPQRCKGRSIGKIAFLNPINRFFAGNFINQRLFSEWYTMNRRDGIVSLEKVTILSLVSNSPLFNMIISNGSWFYIRTFSIGWLNFLQDNNDNVNRTLFNIANHSTLKRPWFTLHCQALW